MPHQWIFACPDFEVVLKPFSFQAKVYLNQEMRTVTMKGKQFPIISSSAMTGHNDKVPATFFLDVDHPIVRTFYLPLTERYMNYSHIHCQCALELCGTGSTSCHCNHRVVLRTVLFSTYSFLPPQGFSS